MDFAESAMAEVKAQEATFHVSLATESGHPFACSHLADVAQNFFAVIKALDYEARMGGVVGSEAGEDAELLQQCVGATADSDCRGLTPRT